MRLSIGSNFSLKLGILIFYVIIISIYPNDKKQKNGNKLNDHNFNHVLIKWWTVRKNK